MSDKIQCPAMLPGNYPAGVIPQCRRNAGHDGSHERFNDVWDDPRPLPPGYVIATQANVDVLVRERDELRAQADGFYNEVQMLRAENEYLKISEQRRTEEVQTAMAEVERLRTALAAMLTSYAPAALDGSMNPGDAAVAGALAALGHDKE